MAPATEYYGLMLKDGTWLPSGRARRHPDLYHSLLRLAYHTLHLHGCFGARLSFGEGHLPGFTGVDH
eukprot:7342234-Prorocentrum_lima.AAC.1